ncbi:transposase IS1182 family protein [Anaeromyxobacter sp. K]|uniref:IS1182-like element ISAnsp1 family transposase n=1 Tax=Anaeromyxobacter sp. (strain K) TaxID=447217 RepID=UPI00015F9204|nr:IS1182-like element ISAnsp1 family transposase [Anaeromyxobacter sp. K]ACG72345.1 transposase IS1182 family protein [Anaeromyxobacter sp. K]ACG72845.1 transposase IS1182 family protein [Anaeromyxobacter sp. K]ACG73005.1 transposase IS1182 family protein [Anaeromyxobacter sp. K]ACG74161.1 transposase IS1182 family protein [Anaeromyxobacter sp. K]ACG75593.1 transposase IS1182 family protein [Anaeromyxobacter sp. K]
MSEHDAPRVVRPVRNQLSLQPTDLEALVADEHPVRAIWGLVERLDLSAFYDEIASRGSNAGRPATDPAVLLALWLFANSEGVGSARLLERLCERDAPYRWICGGVPVNHHTLADFRVIHGKKLDRLMTQVLAALMKEGVVQLKRVAQDGMKVRASAGAASFRRRQSLERCRNEAEEQVRKLRREISEDPSASTKRVTAAKERAAKARLDAIDAALAEIGEVEEERAERDEKKPSDARRRGEIRVSTTDAESRVMKMADGGFRPAYNVQLATDESGFIVGADVTNNGTDQPHVVPMLDEIQRRTGEAPREYLVDGGFVTLDNIEAIAERGATAYAPLPKSKSKDVDPHAPKRNDPPAVGAWRIRMGTEDAKRVYIQRGVLAERTNADLRAHRGLDRLNVRGLVKVKTVVLLAAISFNVMRLIASGLSA